MSALPLTHAHLRLPKLPESLASRRKWIEASVRPAWLLRVSEDEVVSMGDSFIGGNTPYRPEGESWPICPYCAREMGFVMQVDFAPFKDVLKHVQPGIFQFWNCWYCLPSGDAEADARQLQTYQPEVEVYGSSRHLARWYPDEVPGFGEPHDTEQNQAGPTLLRPQPFLSLPQTFDDSMDDWTQEEKSVYEDAFDQQWNREAISQVGGHPSWMQGGKTPLEPKAGRPSTFALALGAGDSGMMWSPAGFYYFFTPPDGDLSEPFVLEQTT